MQDDMIIETASYLSWRDLLAYSKTNKYIKKLLTQSNIEKLLWQLHVKSCFPSAKYLKGMPYKTFFIKLYKLCLKDVSVDSMYLQYMSKDIGDDKHLAVIAINSEIRKRQNLSDYNYHEPCLPILNLLKLESIRYVFNHPKSMLLAYILRLDSTSLGYFFKIFSEEKLHIILMCIKNHLNTIIKKSYLHFGVLDSLNETQRQVFFDNVKGDLTVIIKDGYDFHSVFMKLNEAQRQVIFDAIKGHLSDIFKDVKNLGNVLKYLNEVQRQIVFDVVKGYLSDVIKNNSELSCVLQYLNGPQKAELFSHRQFMLTAMQFDRNYFSEGSQELKGDIYLQTAYYVPFMAFFLLHSEVSLSILLGLAITSIVVVATIAHGLNLAPIATIAVSASALTHGAGFFAMKASGDTHEEVASKNTSLCITKTLN